MNRIQVVLLLFVSLVLACAGKFVYEWGFHNSLTPLAWSPDGRWIAVNIEDPSGSSGTVGLVSAETGQVEKIVYDNGSGAQACYLARFSPDSRQIAASFFGIHLMNISTGEKRELSEGERPKWLQSRGMNPTESVSGSPNKQWKAWIPKSAESSIVWLSGIQKNDPVPVGHSGSYYGLPTVQWTSQSEVILWDTISKPAGIYLYDPQTRRKRFLADGYAPLVSPDGKRVVYVQNGDLKFLSIEDKRAWPL